MYYVAVCDDEAVYREQLLRMLEESKIQEHCVVSDFSSGNALLDACKARIFDLVFLDIEMPGLDGLRTAEALKALNPDMLIIFISNHPNYVFDAFKVEAFRFLIKPVAFENLREELTLAVEKLRSIRAIYALPEGSRVFPVKEIVYLEVRGHILTIHAGDTVSCKGKLDDEEARLAPNRFIRSHKSFLVNPRHILEIDGLAIHLRNGESVPVGKKRKIEVMVQFQDFLARYSV